MKTILIVDDFDSIRKVLSNFLTSKGFLIAEAPNGAAAINIIGEKHATIDLIITDLNMPEFSGMQLLKNIKESPHEHIRSKPVIMLTSDKDINRMKEAKSLGLNAWITKPYRSDQFIAQINHLLS